MISNKTKGVFWMLISVLGFTFMGIAIKYLPRIPTYEKVFFRNSVSFILSAFILFRQKESIKVEKENIPFVFGRSFFGFIGIIRFLNECWVLIINLKNVVTSFGKYKKLF